jgi:hypothetical protein
VLAEEGTVDVAAALEEVLVEAGVVEVVTTMLDVVMTLEVVIGMLEDVVILVEEEVVFEVVIGIVAVFEVVTGVMLFDELTTVVGLITTLVDDVVGAWVSSAQSSSVVDEVVTWELGKHW